MESKRFRDVDYVNFRKEIGAVELHQQEDYFFYFLSNNIKVKNTANSTIAYLIGITDELPTRSISYSGGSMADIDSDVSRDNRQKLIQHARDKWGISNVATIGTYGYLHAKSAIRKTGKVLGYDISFYEDIIKKIPEDLQGEAWTINKLKTVKDFNDLYKSSEEHKRLIDKAEKLEGIIDNRGKHAAGVVIYPEPVNTLVPTWKDGDVETLEFEMHDVESLGMLKIDYLGLKTLDVLDLCVKLIKKNHNIDIELNKIPLDDIGIYRLLGGGHLLGVFQLEGAGMSNACVKFKPEKFTDIALISAGYRPGPLQFLQSIISDRNGSGHSIVPHSQRFPILKDVLTDTYGFMIYQEQVMAMAQLLGGFDQFESDKFRKAIGKKDAAGVELMKIRFAKGAVEKGMTQEDVDLLLDEITAFSKYAFNLSHAIAYSMTTAQTAYLKFYYPEEYFTANMTIESNDVTKVSAFVEEARNVWNIKVVPPYINNAYMTFSVMGKGIIVMGMSGIKGVSSISAEEIITEREMRGPFKSLSDFILRTNSKKGVIEALVKIGAFDKINTRGKYLYNEYIEELIKIVRVFRVKAYNADIMDNSEFLSLPYVPDLPMDKKLEYEMEVANTWISSSPFDMYKNEIAAASGPETVVGYLKSKSAFKTGTGGRISLLTKSGTEEILMFKGAWNTVKAIGEDSLLSVKYQMSGKQDNLFKRGLATSIIPIEKSINNNLEVDITNNIDIGKLNGYINSADYNSLQPLLIKGNRCLFSAYITNNN